MSISPISPKIGVFDSGLGGLSVLREIHRLMPNHPTLYFADQGHMPYGPRDPAEIHTFARAITQFLLDRGAAVVVIACHAASANSLDKLRVEFPAVPFVGVEPAVKPAVTASKSGVIGVLTTQATAEGPLYHRVLARFANGAQVVTRIAPELVLIVESNSQNTPEGRQQITRTLEPLLKAGADQIVLACTHFPFLAEAIQEIAGSEVTLVDPGPAVARQTTRVWPSSAIPTPAANEYFTSGETERLQEMLRDLMGVAAPVTGVRWLENRFVEDA